MKSKGFAVTTMVYGITILFILLLISFLSILSIYQKNLKELLENSNGSRELLKIDVNYDYPSMEALINDDNRKSGLYCFNDSTCMYVSANNNE